MGKRKFLFDRIELRIFEVHNERSAARSIRAERGTRFTSADVIREVGTILKKVHEVRPGNIFEAVQLGPAKFNIVWRGFQGPGE